MSGTLPQLEKQYIEAETVSYHEFEDQTGIEDVIIRFKSNSPLDVLIVKSEQDYINYANDLDYEMYSGCIIQEKYEGEIRCTISTGGIVVWNYHPYPEEYDIEFL